MSVMSTSIFVMPFLFCPPLSSSPVLPSHPPCRPELVGHQFSDVLFMFDDAVPCGIQRNATSTTSSSTSASSSTSSLSSSGSPGLASSHPSPPPHSPAAKHVIINPAPSTVLQVWHLLLAFTSPLNSPNLLFLHLLRLQPHLKSSLLPNGVGFPSSPSPPPPPPSHPAW